MKTALPLLSLLMTLVACSSPPSEGADDTAQAFSTYVSASDSYHCSASITVNDAAPVELSLHSGTTLYVDERSDHNAQHLNAVQVGLQVADLTPALPHYLDSLSPQLHPNPVHYNLFASESVTVKMPAAALEIETLFRSEYSVPLPARYNGPGVSNRFSILRAEGGKTLSYELLYSEPAVGIDSFRMTGTCVRVEEVRDHERVTES